MVRTLNFTLLVVVVALAVSGAGCGSMATAPDMQTVAHPNQVESAQLSTSPADGTASTAPATSSTATLTPITSLVGLLNGLIVRTFDLVGAIGGTLSNGRWTVEVPSGAIDGTAKISVGVASSTSSDCQLEILPLSRNHFAVPVMLTVDCRAVPTRELAGYTIFWFDPVANKWVPVQGAQVDLVAKTVRAPLAHFSRYCVGPADGKAGW